MSNRLSIIVPVLNEAAALDALTQRLHALAALADDLVIVDGGSSDATADRLHQQGFVFMSAAPGRASALNAGARASSGDILVFLHADTLLPTGWDSAIRDALATKAHVWGRFDVRIEGRSRLLPMVARLMNLRSRLTGIATGDQVMFMSRAAFNNVGGFPDQPLMEDIEMSRRLKRLSPPACLRGPVVTSGRRWDARGPITTIVLMWRLRLLYWLGWSPEQLWRMYR